MLEGRTGCTHKVACGWFLRRNQSSEIRWQKANAGKIAFAFGKSYYVWRKGIYKCTASIPTRQLSKLRGKRSKMHRKFSFAAGSAMSSFLPHPKIRHLKRYYAQLISKLFLNSFVVQCCLIVRRDENVLACQHAMCSKAPVTSEHRCIDTFVRNKNMSTVQRSHPFSLQILLAGTHCLRGSYCPVPLKE